MEVIGLKAKQKLISSIRNVDFKPDESNCSDELKGHYTNGFDLTSDLFTFNKIYFVM